MGKISLEKISSLCYMCILCGTHFAEKSHIFYDKVETDRGLATGFTMCKNTIIYRKTNANFQKFYDNSAALDYNAPLFDKYTYVCNWLHCKTCLMHIGWKIDELCVLMDTTFK